MSQTILIFFNMLRGGVEGGIRLPNGYTPASSDWVTGRLIDLPNNAGFQGFDFVDGGAMNSLINHMAMNLGGFGARQDR